MVTRAGPGTSSYVLAFVLPFSLVVITVLTSIRIADKLDRDFLEEVWVLLLVGSLFLVGAGNCSVSAFHLFDKSPDLFFGIYFVLSKS